MAWVDHETYFGPDRRQSRMGLRLINRRQFNHAGEPLSLAAAGRRLTVWSLDVESRQRAVHVAQPLLGMAALLRLHRRNDIAERLGRLALRIKAGEHGNPVSMELRNVAMCLATPGQRSPAKLIGGDGA